MARVSPYYPMPGQPSCFFSIHVQRSSAQRPQHSNRKTDIANKKAQSRRGQPRSSFRVAIQPTRTTLDTIPEWSRVGRGSYGGQLPSYDHTKKVPAHPGKVRLSRAPTPSQYRVEPHPRAARRVAPTRHRHSPRTGQMTTAEISQNTKGPSRRYLGSRKRNRR